MKVLAIILCVGLITLIQGCEVNQVAGKKAEAPKEKTPEPAGPQIPVSAVTPAESKSSEQKSKWLGKWRQVGKFKHSLFVLEFKENELLVKLDCLFSNKLYSLGSKKIPYSIKYEGDRLELLEDVDLTTSAENGKYCRKSISKGKLEFLEKKFGLYEIILLETSETVGIFERL